MSDTTKTNDVSVATLSINGVEYVRKDTIASAPALISDYKIVRTYSAGVFFGIVESRSGQEVVMRNARRLWYWEGAASLSQLAMGGTTKPASCKFPCAVDRVELLQAIEILDVTETAKACIDAVPVWTV